MSACATNALHAGIPCAAFLVSASFEDDAFGDSTHPFGRSLARKRTAVIAALSTELLVVVTEELDPGPLLHAASVSVEIARRDATNIHFRRTERCSFLDDSLTTLTIVMRVIRPEQGQRS
jgi:hypothetical protein